MANEIKNEQNVLLHYLVLPLGFFNTAPAHLPFFVAGEELAEQIQLHHMRQPILFKIRFLDSSQL